MSLPDRILTTTLEPVEFGNQHLYPAVYEKPFEYPEAGEAKQIFYLTERQQRLSKEHLDWQDLTRTSFIEQYDGDAIFTGISIGKRIRGTGVGAMVFRHTVEYLEDNGFYVARTARIRKPLVALMLGREGWRPESIRCEAEVLPDVILEPRVPTIRFVANCLPADQMKERSAHGPFYHVAPDFLVQDRSVDREHVVPLHTPFLPPEDRQLAA